MAIPYSVLDLATVGEGHTSAQALRDSIELAKRTEELGYHRYWVAEHHNMPGVASSAPAVLIAHLASATSSIRVGSGGVMLPNHAPLVVAEQFGMLEALHPGRIDLGLGRAPGTDPRTAHALRRSPQPLSADDFPEQLSELIAYFRGEAEGIAAVPAAGNQPPIWLLGSSGYSAQLSGMLGLPFAFAHHFSAQNTLPALALYRQNFRPSAVLDKPYAMVAAGVICADTDEQAAYIAGPGALSFLKLRSGRPGLISTPEEAAAYPYTDVERLIVEDRLSSQIVGSPSTVERGIEKLLSETEADELMITTMVHSATDRLHSYELVAGLRA
ncbi:LLM class flavin-dependent oxidoreductase [Kibdelosporangium phytohabitans]|uniref:LLM class flavin-dependent oxidoreductase n=1 Tax=Kibdelosporangium phytohabitans TaxID=860235 RepID=UPI000AAA6089|nr:LLM class flavin-dependent oxidoreductase [Kibdelosporangium phytohabitans]MBE1470987.1 luciferase family oxidoreductase group 1 [Kibdelosporangium phytohabitans]